MWGADAWSSMPWASITAVPTGIPTVPGVVPVVAHLAGTLEAFALSGAADTFTLSGAAEAYALPTIQGVQ